MSEEKKTIHLIDVGTIPAKKYVEVVVDDVLMYDGGFKGTVTEVTDCGGERVLVTVCWEDGSVTKCNRCKNILVGVVV